MDENPLTYAGFPHTYGPPYMTENPGVPGSKAMDLVSLASLGLPTFMRLAKLLGMPT